MIIDLGPLTIKIDVLIVQIINVAILFFFFKKLFWDTLIEEIAQRRAMTQKLEKAYKEYDALIAEANAKKEEILAEAMSHKKWLVAEATALAKQEWEKIIEKAMIEAKMLVEKAEKEASAQKHDMEKSFANWVKQSAMAMLKKLFSSNKKAWETYVSGLIDEFDASYKKSDK